MLNAAFRTSAAMIFLSAACTSPRTESTTLPDSPTESPSPGVPAAPSETSAASPPAGSPTGNSTTGNPTTGGTIFPADNAWNTDISNAAVDCSSDAYIDSIGRMLGIHADLGDFYAIPYVEVPGNQPMVPVEFTVWPEESDPGPYPIPDNAPIEKNGDSHVIVVDRSNGWLYELYQAKKKPNGWSASNGAKWNLKSNAGRPPGWTSADAAGLPVFPGLIRYDEVVEKGEITHALRFTVEPSQRGYVAPASHFASTNTNPNLPPMGCVCDSRHPSTFQDTRRRCRSSCAHSKSTA